MSAYIYEEKEKTLYIERKSQVDHVTEQCKKYMDGPRLFGDH